MREKPSLRWPALWLVFAIYLAGWAFVDSFVDTEADQTEALGFLPVCVACVVAAWRHVERRFKQREQWRDERLIAWLLDDLPAPEQTDWTSFEADVEATLRRQQY